MKSTNLTEERTKKSEKTVKKRSVVVVWAERAVTPKIIFEPSTERRSGIIEREK